VRARHGFVITIVHERRRTLAWRGRFAAKALDCPHIAGEEDVMIDA